MTGWVNWASCWARRSDGLGELGQLLGKASSRVGWIQRVVWQGEFTGWVDWASCWARRIHGLGGLGELFGKANSRVVWIRRVDGSMQWPPEALAHLQLILRQVLAVLHNLDPPINVHSSRHRAGVAALLSPQDVASSATTPVSDRTHPPGRH